MDMGPQHAATSSSDPGPVILARIEVKLDNALDDMREHKLTLDRHETAIVANGNRITSLEAAAAAASSSSRSWPAWTSAAISGLALLALILKDVYS